MLVRTILLICLFYCQSVVAEKFIFSSAPTESAEKSAQIFVPIAEYLSRMTGDDYQFEYPGSWYQYIEKMQTSHYDLLFDAPHMVSWRMAHIEHTPLVRFPFELTYSLISKSESRLNRLDDLKGKFVCSFSTPSLSAILLLDLYGDLVALPQLHSSVGFRDVFQSMVDDKCDAAILPSTVYTRLRSSSPDPLQLLFESLDFPHYAFSSGPSISDVARNKLKDALMHSDSDQALLALKNTYGVFGMLIPASFADYSGYDYLLEEYPGF